MNNKSQSSQEQTEMPVVKIEEQSARSIETELALKMDGINHAINSIDEAQHITQDRLQLEVSV